MSLKITQNDAVDSGRLMVTVHSSLNSFPITGASVSISPRDGDGKVIERLTTDTSGQTEEIALGTPPLEYSMEPGEPRPYSEFTISVTAGAIVWSYVFTDVYSPLTGNVSPLGLPSQVVPAMAIMASWRDMGYCMLIYIAALQTMSQDFYEAATVEGANAWQKFIHITIPMIVPAFTTNITLILAWGLRTFDLPMVVAANLQEGQTTAVYIYQSIFANNKARLGQAAAIILTVILIVLTQIVTRVLRRLEVET